MAAGRALGAGERGWGWGFSSLAPGSFGFLGALRALPRLTPLLPLAGGSWLRGLLGWARPER